MTAVLEMPYLNLLQHILDNGVISGDRTGTGTLSVFGAQCRYDLSNGFPLITTKKMYTRAIIYELLWFIQGNTNNNWLNKYNVHIWDEWAPPSGDLGPIYGKQWRDYGPTHIDQLAEAVRLIKTDPNSRRIIVCAWNPTDQSEMALPPCHCFFQFYVRDNKLSCQLYQRSMDSFLGALFNIASYSLLTCMIADSCGLERGEFIHTVGDAHIYRNHLEQVKSQLKRMPYSSPVLKLRHRDSVFDYIYEDIEIADYRYWPAIKGEVSV